MCNGGARALSGLQARSLGSRALLVGLGEAARLAVLDDVVRLGGPHDDPDIGVLEDQGLLGLERRLVGTAVERRSEDPETARRRREGG